MTLAGVGRHFLQSSGIEGLPLGWELGVQFEEKEHQIQHVAVYWLLLLF